MESQLVCGDVFAIAVLAPISTWEDTVVSLIILSISCQTRTVNAFACFGWFRRYMKRKAACTVGFEYCHGCFIETFQMASPVGNVPVVPQLVFA